MDIYSPYAERRSISEPPSSSASDDDLYTNLWRSQTTGNPNSRFANHRNSYSDSIDLDVDDDHYNPDAELARQLTNGLPDYDVGLGHSLPNYDRVIQENVDKEIARQLQQEEEDRRRQENARPSTRDCAVCGEATPIPDFPALVDCSHRPQTCVDCYQGWIASELSNNQWNKIKCPEHKCRVILKHHEVQQYATAEVYAKFDTLSARSVLNDEPNFRWCRARDCQSGQIHISGEEGNIFRCVACGFRVCIIHEDTWHEGETCEEYDYRKCGRKERDQKKQEEASVKAIEELTKRCPGHGCKWNIEKNEGCDHMTCSKCRHEFCWICLAPYNRIRKKGNSAHNQDCKYHTNRIS
ncbi:hypothetical protein K469DRAFT_553519 [Zopfia rhizophila CBS 207.26]|uniref:RBR-type E3 ubiquitin transferase n=1 Tax=Zopfia rhizophila CBS 207.26 TaxID=1314779 RepID=A0A6A6ENG8_9PEZI|nr:hypothetical protein K469DRAFT_553519 [Zopfia rhizophila CBS 207.26]